MSTQESLTKENWLFDANVFLMSIFEPIDREFSANPPTEHWSDWIDAARTAVEKSKVANVLNIQDERSYSVVLKLLETLREQFAQQPDTEHWGLCKHYMVRHSELLGFTLSL